jgi:hypothetical protein
MSTITAVEAKQNYIAKMGQPLGAQFAELWQQVADLHMKWLEYVELYGTNQKRFDLMHKAAPHFFQMLGDMMYRDTLLHIARLTDKQNNYPPKRRLTLRNLSQLVKDPTIRSQVEVLFVKVEQDAELVRDWRDRAGAHLSLSFALDDPSAPSVMMPSRKQINDMVDGIVALMNAVSAHYNDSQSIFRIGTSAGGALCLLYVLDSGIRADASRRERLISGKATPEDYGRRDI